MNALFIRIAPFLFKPSLDHQDPSIRLLALNRLDLNVDQHQSTFLSWLAQEQDLKLLKEAISRFPSPIKLIELFNQNQLNQNKQNEPLYQALSQHLQLLLTNDAKFNTAERQSMSSQITDQALLLSLVQHSEPLDFRLSLLAQLEATEADWLAITLTNSLAKVRQVAAEKITSEAALEQLVKEAQGDKRVQRMARDKLNAHRAAQQAEQEAAQLRLQLLEQLQKLVNVGDETLYQARLEHLTNQWQEIQLAHKSELTERFEQLSQQAQQFIQQLQTAAAAQETQEALRQEAKTRQQQLQSQLDELVEQLKAQPAVTEQLLTSQLAAEWQQTLAAAVPSKNEQKTFEQQLHLANELIACSSAWQETQPKLAEQLATLGSQPSPAQLQQLSSLLSSINWHKNLPVPELVTQANQVLSTCDQQKKNARQAVQDAKQLNLDRIEQNFIQLEQLIDLGQSKEAIRLHQQLQTEADTLGNNHRLAIFFRGLSARIAELKDWQGFVAAPKREALCEQMEALAADASMLPQVKADKIQALQQEWRELGSAAANKTLWDKFKQAADLAYEPCKVWFAAQNEVRNYNQTQKAVICSELEQLAVSGGLLAMEEEALDELLVQVHEEWHRFNPVNRAEGKQLANRFQQALIPIREQLYQLRQTHADDKRALIEAAKALLESEDLQAATEASKLLQQEWRTLGAAPGSLEHQLWKEFRTQCDNLFKLRDEQRKNRLEERLQRFSLARQQLAEAKVALATGEYQQANKLFQQAAGLRNIPKKEQQNWQAELDNLAEQLQRIEQQQARKGLTQQLDDLLTALPEVGEPEDQIEAKRLIVELELLVGVAAQTEDQQLRLQLQINRMNAGLGVPDEATTLQEIQQLLAKWHEIGGSTSSPLGQRLVAAINTYKNPS